jgi:hypothetical protein
MRAVVFSQKRPGNIRRKLLSEHNFFEPNEFDAWLAHMEELGWKFPRNVLETLVGATHWLPWYNSIMVAPATKTPNPNKRIPTLSYMDEKFTATHPSGGTMRIVRKNLLDKETDAFLRVTVYFPKTSPGPLRVSTKLEFHEGEDGTREDWDAWLTHMEEMGWKFPRNLLDPLGSSNGGGWGESALSPCAVGRTGRHNERT